MAKVEHIKKLSLEEFVDLYETSLFKLNSHRKTFWYYLIKSKQLTCRVTNKTVSYCGLDYYRKNNQYSYNFYSEDDELFNIDHKLPKSLGGTNDFSNIQPMIAEENMKKGSQLIYL